MSYHRAFDNFDIYPKILSIHVDLAGCEEIQSAHLAEALQYRPKLMMG
jgi:predicted ATPase with chaperone activity